MKIIIKSENQDIEIKNRIARDSLLWMGYYVVVFLLIPVLFYIFSNLSWSQPIVISVLAVLIIITCWGIWDTRVGTQQNIVVDIRENKIWKGRTWYELTESTFHYKSSRYFSFLSHYHLKTRDIFDVVIAIGIKDGIRFSMNPEDFTKLSEALRSNGIEIKKLEK